MFRRFQWLSAKNILENIKDLFLRFPFVASDTFIATVCAYILIESNDWNISDSLEHILTKILLMTVLGFPLLTSGVLVAEKFQWKKPFLLLTQIVGLGLLSLYYFLLPENPNDFGMVESTRLVILNIVAYLFALSFPFYEKGKSLQFWRFVEAAFARLVVSAFFSLTLWAGIALSLAAIDYLFGVNIQSDFYLKALVIIVGIFGAWFFLAGFPHVNKSLPDAAENSKVLKIFIQYICVPLLVIFFVILYVYLGKILVLWDWPKGGVADWILGFSIAGFLTYILSYPLLEKNDYPFLKKFFQVFFALVLPMVGVLFLAIGIRVKEYGVTESRYLVGLGGVWLLVSSLYFLFFKQKELKVMPYLAAIFLFLASFGPWGMYHVSVYSQYARLEALLQQNNLLQDGISKPVADENTIPLNQRESIHSKIQFLALHEDVTKLHEWFPTVSTTNQYGGDAYGFANSAMESLNIKNYYNYQNSLEDQKYIYLEGQSNGIIDIRGFDSFIGPVYLYDSQNGAGLPDFAVASSTPYLFKLENNHLKVFENDIEKMNMDITSYFETWKQNFDARKGKEVLGKMEVEAQSEKLRLKFIFDHVSLVNQSGTGWKIQSADMHVLLDVK